MYTIYYDWENLKNDIIKKGYPFNYKTLSKGYEVFVYDRGILWTSNIINDDEILDFKTNYKERGNRCLYSEDGKEITRAESRPLDTTTCFTGRGDSDTGIGEGKELRWDFSNDDDDITPSGVNYKKKRIVFKFSDSVYVKEGAVYFLTAKKGSYIDLHIVCPAGQYYLDNNGTPHLAEEDTAISHYVISHWLLGDCPMGDELNTESCSVEIPSIYKFWLDIIVPEDDNISCGHISLELYRKRTVIL
ncbi:MAG: hypothetical protein JW924_03355 [Fusobacteriaceae bacterium]|nr:hypothetical protein [Fusobacteriaceae bacterium]